MSAIANGHRGQKKVIMIGVGESATAACLAKNGFQV